MKIFYLAAGAFLEWVIRTEEGKNFANNIMTKGYALVKENISNVLPKSEEPNKNNGAIFSDSGHNGDNKRLFESSTQRQSKDSTGATETR